MPPGADTVELTADRRQQLDRVQAEINQTIAPRENPAHFWEYAVAGAGDCNSYALTKRATLIGLGWPVAALRLAAVHTERDEAHLVLVAHTTAGDLVLDNRAPTVRLWSTLPYRWVTMQAPQSPARWVKVIDEPILTADAGAGTQGNAAHLRIAQPGLQFRSVQ